ncbi:MAG: phosphoribosyltransferase [Gemmataceae bacterium]
MFRDRRDAAQQLAARLKGQPLRDPLVLGIPRGGVVLADGIAAEIGADVDVVLSRKLRAPGQPELALGAVAEDGRLFLNFPEEDMDDRLRDYLDDERAYQMGEIARRQKYYRSVRPPAPLADRSIIVSDDGIATGATMMAALRVLREHQPHEVIVAVPVAPPTRLKQVARHASEVICLISPEDFLAIGQFYENFEAVRDEEVVALLRQYAPVG